MQNDLGGLLTKNQQKFLTIKSFRMSNFYKIVNKDHRLVYFRPNLAQQVFFNKKYIRKAGRKTKIRYKKNIILKARQLGFTTLQAIDMLDDMCFKPGFEGLFIAHQRDAAEDIFQNKIKLAWGHYKLNLLYDVVVDRLDLFKVGFGDGPNEYNRRLGQQTSSIAVKLSGRSGTYSRLHVTELAKMAKSYPERAKELIRGTFPALPFGTPIDIESTAEGDTGEFHDMFWEAWDKGEPESDMDYKAHFYNWQYDIAEISKVKEEDIIRLKKNLPAEFIGYQIQNKLSDREIVYYYLKWLSLNRDWEALLQEYPTTPVEAFQFSGERVFSAEKLEVMRRTQLIEPTSPYDGWSVYEDYQPGHVYALGADVSEGVGSSSSTIVVMDFTHVPARVVAIYENPNISPDNFAYEIRRGSQMYGNCLCGVERNNAGHGTLTELKRIYNSRYIYRMRSTASKDNKRARKLGWHTTGSSKPKMIYELQTAISDDEIIIPSKELITELRTYNSDNIRQVRLDPNQSDHWDRVMALAICWQMREEVYRKDARLSPLLRRNVIRDYGYDDDMPIEEFCEYDVF